MLYTFKDTYFCNMTKVDYIVVGCGLAGIAFCEQLRVNNKTFIVFDDSSQQSSIVAAGLYNPVILKRFTPVWKAKLQLELAMPFYKHLEQQLNVKLDYKLRVLRRFASIEEQNLWFTACDHPGLEAFLSPKIVKNTENNLDAPYGYGEVLGAGRLDTNVLIESYKAYLKTNNELIEEAFDYHALLPVCGASEYKTYVAKHIVFAEGFGLKQNPFFNHLPLNGTKGEVIDIKIPKLNIDYAVKSAVFMIPSGVDRYTVGATYNWKDKSNVPTQQGKEELITKLKTFLKSDFEVIKHIAGIRPTVKDRRPLLGKHHEYKSLYVLNGMGTRGVMNAPYAAKALYDHIENNKPLETEMDINRFSD